MHLKPIDQQVVAILGASSGIGRKTALSFNTHLAAKWGTLAALGVTALALLATPSAGG
jgi:NADP-dependent 3-hydroxy acid dehydrogenase YdfG